MKSADFFLARRAAEKRAAEARGLSVDAYKIRAIREAESKRQAVRMFQGSWQSPAPDTAKGGIMPRE